MESYVPPKVKPEVDRAVQLELAGQYADAASLYRAALTKEPDNAFLYNGLGCAHANQGQYAEAINAFADAARLTPANRARGVHPPSSYPQEPERNMREAAFRMNVPEATPQPLLRLLLLTPVYAIAAALAITAFLRVVGWSWQEAYETTRARQWWFLPLGALLGFLLRPSPSDHLRLPVRSAGLLLGLLVAVVLGLSARQNEVLADAPALLYAAAPCVGLGLGVALSLFMRSKPLGRQVARPWGGTQPELIATASAVGLALGACLGLVLGLVTRAIGWQGVSMGLAAGGGFMLGGSIGAPIAPLAWWWLERHGGTAGRTPRTDPLVDPAMSWNLFVSYKSQSANLVRRVVERLMSCGYRVWFAEYCVVLRNYDDFAKAIDDGVAKNQRALLFTTPLYMQSPNCQYEVSSLKRALAAHAEKMVEVVLAPNDTVEKLGLPPSHPVIRVQESNGTDERELIERIGRMTGLDLSDCDFSPPAAPPERFGPKGIPVTFDIGGFDLTKRRTEVDGTEALFFSWRQQPRFGFNVFFQFDPQKTPREFFSTQQEDDKAVYNELRQYAEWFMGAMQQQGAALEELGLHVIWLHGRSQFAITHSAQGICMRKYSIIVKASGRPLQIIITFGLPGSLMSFLRFAPIMDRVVDSITTEE